MELDREWGRESDQALPSESERELDPVSGLDPASVQPMALAMALESVWGPPTELAMVSDSAWGRREESGSGLVVVSEMALMLESAQGVPSGQDSMCQAAVELPSDSKSREIQGP